MKNLILSTLVICFVQLAQSRPVLISDIDDTIKESNVLSTTNAVIRGGRTDKDMSFHGMAELYRLLAVENENIDMNYISNAPMIPMSYFHDKFLKQSKYPQADNLYLREDRGEDHKLTYISKILDIVQPDEVILIGDNGEKDSEIYSQIANQYPEIKFHVFVRVVYTHAEGGSALEGGQTAFVSSADLALHLFKANLLSWDSADKILNLNIKKSILDIFKSPGELLRLPEYVNCQDYEIAPEWQSSKNTSVQKLIVALKDRCELN